MNNDSSNPNPSPNANANPNANLSEKAEQEIQDQEKEEEKEKEQGFAESILGAIEDSIEAIQSRNKKNIKSPLSNEEEKKTSSCVNNKKSHESDQEKTSKHQNLLKKAMLFLGNDEIQPHKCTYTLSAHDRNSSHIFESHELEIWHQPSRVTVLTNYMTELQNLLENHLEKSRNQEISVSGNASGFSLEARLQNSSLFLASESSSELLRLSSENFLFGTESGLEKKKHKFEGSSLKLSTVRSSECYSRTSGIPDSRESGIPDPVENGGFSDSESEGLTVSMNYTVVFQDQDQDRDQDQDQDRDQGQDRGEEKCHVTAEDVDIKIGGELALNIDTTQG